jgi:hypothetical protein
MKILATVATGTLETRKMREAQPIQPDRSEKLSCKVIK